MPDMPSASRPMQRGTAPFLTIRPRKRWMELNLAELWMYRDLLLTLIWRDIKVRYKQTVLGMAWAVIQPLAGMAVFTLVFSRMAKLPTDGIPAPLFYYAGLLAWTFFSQTVSGASQSLIEGSHLVTKVYFPRIIIPASVIGYATLNLCVSTVLLLPLMLYFGIRPSWTVILLPPVCVLLGVASLGVALLLAALNVKYRDFRYVVPFLLQIAMFATPVVYPASLIPQDWRWLASLNPMTGMTEAFRACLFGSLPDWTMFGMSTAAGMAVFIFSVAYFRRVEDDMADML